MHNSNVTVPVIRPTELKIFVCTFEGSPLVRYVSVRAPHCRTTIFFSSGRHERLSVLLVFFGTIDLSPARVLLFTRYFILFDSEYLQTFTRRCSIVRRFLVNSEKLAFLSSALNLCPFFLLIFRPKSKQLSRTSVLCKHYHIGLTSNGLTDDRRNAVRCQCKS